jgi:rhamnose utilization protein RhaD (predicted bifunctional aldolase and dehydrogenase)/NAD(P)-dependent dehydrogenase (short-subunit alcohol dehydrogenase family)
MKSRWNEARAREAVARYGAAGVGEALALRTYSARLLGADPELVLHGGGNTSVKASASDLFGEDIPVIHVKGSGWDLASIEPPGHPAVRLEPLLRLRGLDRLSDEAMVNALRQNLLDAAAPTPSVETLLHAFIPQRFIDHTHALAVLALANQPDAEEVLAEVYGERVALVPYVMPGFELAQRAAQAFESRPGLEGLILVNHGVFSFGATAQESYERMIALVSLAEDHVQGRRRRAPIAPARRAASPELAAEVLPALRGLLAAKAETEASSPWLLDLRDGEAAMTLCGAGDLEALARRGVATPDHVIRTKREPLVLPAPGGDMASWREAAARRLDDFVADYQAYFARNAARFPEGRRALDPLPRLLAIPGLGLAGVGRTAAEAAIAADIGESWAQTLLAAEAVGRFQPLDEAQTFDMEYWSLEQAKLGKAARRRLEGRVAVVTGGAGAIGRATALAFAGEGAEIALIDIDGEAVADAARAVGPRAMAVRCDVTRPREVDAAFDAVCRRFGGLDILVSNAGVAVAGAMTALDDEDLRRSFEINFFAHQCVARAAVRVLRRQAMGGVLLFNVSKQALNPGPDFGAYGTSKAALLALVRQYALEHGADGIRVNALNPDRIRSGLLTDAMIAGRAAARGVDEAAYMAGNLLGREVTAQDVAQAFVFAALMRRTTGAVIPVDGGNVAAMVR